MAAYSYSAEDYETVHTQPGNGESDDGGWHSRSKTPTPATMATDTSMDASEYSYGSLEAFGGDDLNVSANILEELEEIRHQNRKLAENAAKFRTQLEITEESRAELLSNYEYAERKIKTFVHENTVLRDKVEELCHEFSAVEEENLAQQRKIGELEKEKQMLKNTVQVLEKEDREIGILKDNIAYLEQEVERMQRELEIKETMLSDAKSHRKEVIHQLLENTKSHEELQTSHADLQKAYQCLKVKKNDVEQELAEIQRQMATSRPRLQSDLLLSPIEGDLPQLQSTPTSEVNLLSELKIFVNDDQLPSPICGPVVYETDPGRFQPFYEGSLPSSPPGSQGQGRSEVLTKLQVIAESMISEVQSMLTVQHDGVAPADQEFLQQTVHQLRLQLDSLLCNMKWVVEAKRNSDERAIKMGEQLRGLREENSQLKASLERSAAVNDVNVDEEHLALGHVTNELELARAEVEIMEFTALRDQQRIADLENMITITQKDLDITSSELKYQMQEMDEQMQLRHLAERELEETKRILDATQVRVDTRVKGTNSENEEKQICSFCRGLMEVRRGDFNPETTSPAEHARDQQGYSKTPSIAPHQGLEDFVRKLQSANEEFINLNDIASDDDSIPDCESIEPLLESGYRTDVSVGRSPVTSFTKNGPRFLLAHPKPRPLSAIIDALALDAFPDPCQLLPSTRSVTYTASPNILWSICPRCRYRLNLTDCDIYSSAALGGTLYRLSGAVDPLSLSKGVIREPGTPDSLGRYEEFRNVVKPPHRTCNVGTQSEQTDGVLLRGPCRDCVDVSAGDKVRACHAYCQTEQTVVIRELAGTQTDEAGSQSHERPEATSEGTQCDQPSVCQQGVLASVPQTDGESQTDNVDILGDGVSPEVTTRIIVPPSPKAKTLHHPGPLLMRQTASSQTDLSVRISVTDRAIVLDSVATQTLPSPIPNTTPTPCFSFDSAPSIPLPPPPAHPDNPVQGAKSLFLAPCSLPARVIAEDWDSDFSTDSPSFVSARSSPVTFSPLPFSSQLDSRETAIPNVIERLTTTFQPITSNRERMEQALPVSLDENSNKETRVDGTNLERPRGSSPEKATMRQKRPLERERKYSGVIQASNGEMVDLTTAQIDVSSISPADQALNEKLLAESRKASERFQNRRGRKYSPGKKEDKKECRLDDSTSDSSPEPPDSSPRSITQEERVGAEGDSDPEEEKKSLHRKDSDECDIKADLIKAIGTISPDSPTKSPLTSNRLRQEKKAKRPAFILPMPELCEEVCEMDSPKRLNESLDSVSDASKDSCRVEATSECSIKQDGEVRWDGADMDSKQRKSSILSDTLLKALGLKKGEGDNKDTLTEQEVEEKYNSLTFALKTDRLTLAQRYKLQQHQRDVVEQNLKEELRDHSIVVQSLERRCAEDEIARTDINKLKQHIDVMEYALVKLASRAEGFGAVQQEDRLSKAEEIMVSYVEIIKRSLDKERAELAEAKKLLHENKILMRGNSLVGLGQNDDFDTGSGKLRRSSTMTSPTMKTGRRRASVAAVLGFGSGGSSGLDGRNRFASLATAAMMDRSLTGPFGNRGVLDTCKENGSDKSEKGDSPRLADSNKKKLSLSISNPSPGSDSVPVGQIRPLTPPAAVPIIKPPSPLRTTSNQSLPTTPTTPPVVVSEEGGVKGGVARNKSEEEIFQEGFEQGLRSQISQELDDLREQQRALCENLEEIMEAAEDEEEEENEKNSETQPFLLWVRQCSRSLPWSRAGRVGRLFLTGTLFLLALISIIGTLLPLERCRGGVDILAAPWEGVRRLLEPHTDVYHPRPPPT